MQPLAHSDALLSCHRYGEILPPVQSNLATWQIQRFAAARRFRSEQTGSKVRIARHPPRTPKSGNFSVGMRQAGLNNEYRPLRNILILLGDDNSRIRLSSL